jgi:hypothetical protein
LLRAGLVAGALAAISAPSATAADLTRSSAGHTYFHRANASIEDHDAHLRACQRTAAAFKQPQTAAPAGGGGLLGALVLGVVQGAVEGMQTRRGLAANIENCMVAKGWRVVRLPDTEGAEIAALPQPEQSKRLTQLVGAQPARGEVVRAFANEALDPTTRMFAPAGDLDKVALSLTALAPQAAQAEAAKTADAAKPSRPKIAKSAYPPSPLKPDQIGAVGSDKGLVLVRVTDQGSNARSYVFSRVAPNPDLPAWADGQPSSFTATLPVSAWSGKSKSKDLTLAFALPPGRWLLAAVGQPVGTSIYYTSFCLGAPGFDLAAGDVVFAGAFQVDGASGHPDMALEPARQALAAHPQLQERLKPASYVNGYTGECGATAYGYVLELPDAPFAPNYTQGSKASVGLTSATSTEAAPTS